MLWIAQIFLHFQSSEPYAAVQNIELPQNTRVKLNVSLWKLYFLCNFTQKSVRFVILFHYISVLLMLLLLFWMGFCVLLRWISPHPDLPHTANAKCVALYIKLPPNSPIQAWVFHMVSVHQVSPPKPWTHLFSPHTRYMHQQSHSSQFYHPNSIMWDVQTIKLLFMLPYIGWNPKKKAL